MPRHPVTNPDSVSQNPSSFQAETGELRAWPAATNFQTDLADLAARFAARGGAPEFAAQLALEIVLNEIVEQGCLATGASGVAIALERDNELECRATTGLTAPELGAPLDTGQGLSGECIRTRQIQICHDAETDPRVDARASRDLGVRSVIVLPLVRGAELFGVLEAFSTKPAAFGERDQRTLEALTQRVLHNIELAAHWSAGAQDRIAPNPTKVDGSEIDGAKIEEARIDGRTVGEVRVDGVKTREANNGRGSMDAARIDMPLAGSVENIASDATASDAGEQEPHFHFHPDALKRTSGRNGAGRDDAESERKISDQSPADGAESKQVKSYADEAHEVGPADLQSAELGPGHAGSAEVLMSAIQSRVRPSRVISFLTAVMGGIICLTAIGLTLRVAQRFGWIDWGSHSRSEVTAAQVTANPANGVASQPGSETIAANSGSPSKPASANAVSSSPATANAASTGTKALPPGSLMVSENGKEVFRMVPVFKNSQSDNQPNGQAGTPQDKQAAAANSSSSAKTGVERAAAIEPEKIASEPVMQLSASAAEEGLLTRVEPEYPEAARQQKIQGAVVLDVRVRRDGTVQQVTLVSGDSVLANAAIAAVNRWQFKPHSVNGQTVAMQTRVTLNFRLSR
jgi:TonB family protein